MKLTPTAVCRTRASPGPGSPRVISSHCMTSGPPVRWILIAWGMLLAPLRFDGINRDDTLPLRSAIAFEDAELGGHAGVEDADSLLPQQREQLLGFFVGDHELDLDRRVGRELEEVLLVQDAVAPETGNRPESGSAVDAELLRLLEQPFE